MHGARESADGSVRAAMPAKQQAGRARPLFRAGPSASEHRGSEHLDRVCVRLTDCRCQEELNKQSEHGEYARQHYSRHLNAVPGNK